MGKNLSTLTEEIAELNIITGEKDVSVEAGYVSDLLSDVMRNAKPNSIWITIQHHENVIAVAAMAEISVIVFSNGITPEEEIIKRAEDEGMILCSYPDSSFELVGRLYQLGVNG